MLNSKDLATLAKHANNKALLHLELQSKHPVFSGKHIDHGVRAQQYLDYLDSIIKDAFHNMNTQDYKEFINSIA